MHWTECGTGQNLSWYPGRDHRHGGEDFFSKILIFQKKCIFEDQKVIFVGSNYSRAYSVLRVFFEKKGEWGEGFFQRKFKIGQVE